MEFKKYDRWTDDEVKVFIKLKFGGRNPAETGKSCRREIWVCDMP